MYNFARHYGLYESEPIWIDQIDTFKDDKLFVTVGGGIGAGKTFLTKKFIGLPILDMDEYIIKVGGGEYNRDNLGEGRKLFHTSLELALEGDKSFVHMGTNSNLESTQKRLQKAKGNGFTTVLVLIDTPPQIAAKQIEQRAEEGGRGNILMERIVQSHGDSLNVFITLKKDNNLVDFYVHNKR